MSTINKIKESMHEKGSDTSGTFRMASLKIYEKNETKNVDVV